MPDIREPSKDMIEDIISTNTLDDLLHLKETSWFEFREKHYSTTSPEPSGKKAKYELAKDCSSIANSGGGYIFIGLKPAISETQMTEYVAQITGIKKTDINLASWRDSLLNMLVPRFTLEDIEHGFIDIDDEKSVIWMRIPAATDKGVYPLMLKNDQLQAGAHKIKGNVIGVYERHGAENLLLSPEKLQSYISQSISIEETGQTFSQDIRRLESKADSLVNTQNSSTREVEFDEQLKKALREATERLGDDAGGFFYIYSMPNTKLELPNFWNPYTDPNSIPMLMKNPPRLRRMGWDLSVAMQERPAAEPGAWEIKNGDRKLLRVTENSGVFAAGMLKGFLDWGLDERATSEGYGILINEYALSEYVAMYFAFLEKLVVERTDVGKGSVSFKTGFGFVSSGDISVGLHEPALPGIPSNGTIGPMREQSAWKIDRINPTNPYNNAGFIIQQIMRSGFGGTEDSEYFIRREDGQLVFDPTSYSRT